MTVTGGADATTNTTSSSSSSSSSLLTNVGYMGLQNLLNEPLRLKLESSRVNKELDSLVLENYRLFIDNITSNAQIKNKDKKIGEESAVLKDNLSILSEQCNSFRERVNYFINSHKRNRKTLQHHMQILELLEVPQLVDACARNAFHDEALELANFVNGLEKRHLLANEVKIGSKNDAAAVAGNTVIQSIVDDVHETLVSLRHQLLVMLSENSSLPKVLQILLTLRKLDGLLIDRQIEIERRENSLLVAISDKSREDLKGHFVCLSECRIQMDFLEARTIWLQRIVEKTLSGSSIGGAAAGDVEGSEGGGGAASSGVALGPYGRAMELVEVYRASLFSIAQQFQSLFSDTASASSGVGANCSPLLVLSTWVMHQTRQLLDSLSMLLPLIEDGASIRNVYEQSLFLANRFSAIGCDITLLVIPIFKESILAKISNDYKTSLSVFKNIITHERFILGDAPSTAVGFSKSSSALVPLYMAPEGDEGSSAATADATAAPGNTPSKRGVADEVAPPMLLLTYPPVAFLLNSVLGVFNFIREIPINVLKEVVLSSLGAFLSDVCSFIVDNKILLKNKTNKYMNSSGGSLDAMYASVLLTVLVPQLLSSYDLIFHNDVGSNNKISFNINNDKIEKVTDAKKFLSGNCYNVYEKIWSLFENK